MRNLLLLAILLFVFSRPLFSADNEKRQPKDTLSFHVFVACDRLGVEHFGGEKIYREKLDDLFRRSNDFWNNGSDRLKYYFRFIPDLQLIYEGSSKIVEKFYGNNFGSTAHDVLLIIDSKLDYDDENGGWYCSGARDALSVVCCRGRSKTDFENIFDKGHRGIVHEFGHYRAVTDLYADRIKADKNRVNNLAYEPDSCIMNNHHKTDKWSDYAVNIINHTANAKRIGKEFPGFFREMFPENICVDVRVKGKKKAGIKLNLYGSRAKHNDLVATPYRQYETDKTGRCVITGVPALYDQPAPPLHTDDLPYNRWFTFVLEAEYNGEKQYVWLPEYKLQNLFFEKKDTHRVTINF